MSVLAVKRGIEASNALLKERNGEIVQNIKIKRKTMRTLDTTEGVKDESKAVANIQQVDVANMSEGFTELLMSYNLKFLPAIQVELYDSLERDFVEKTIALFESGHSKIIEAKKILGRAILNKIVSGDAGWRNKTIAMDVRTNLILKEVHEGELVSVPYSFLNTELMGVSVFNSKREVVLPVRKEEQENFEKIALKIIDALFNGGPKIILEVEHVYNIGTDKSEVYPSQVFDDNKDKKSGRPLFEIDGCAAITSQKLQNALRRYDGFSSADRDISVSEWGADLSTSQAYRNGKTDITEKGFYSYKKEMIKSEAIDSFIEGLEVEELFYFCAVLLKGGLFNSPSTKK